MSSEQSGTHTENGHGTVGHIVPVHVLAAVGLTLMAFTFITVASTWVNLGRFNIWIAMAIATFKASLVLLYFMHLRYDKPFNGLVLITSLLFVGLFIGFALMDTVEYHPEQIPGYAPAMQQR